MGARSKAWVCGRSLTEIVGSNPTGGAWMFVCCECCVLSGRGLCDEMITRHVLPLSNEHGSQVKDQGRRQCCQNKHKNFPYRSTRDVTLLSGHTFTYIVLLRIMRTALLELLN